MMENSGPFRAIGLKGADAFVGLFSEFGAIVFNAHQIRTIIFGDV